MQAPVHAVLSIGHHADPFQKIYGLTLFERSMRALERAGVAHVTCLAKEIDLPKTQQLLEKTAPWKCKWTLKASTGDPSILPDLAAPGSNGGVLVMQYPLVVSPGVLKMLMENERLETGPYHIKALGNRLQFFNKEALQLSVNPPNGSSKNIGSYIIPTSELSRPAQNYCLLVRDADEVKAAKKALRRSLVKPSDGWVSRHLNRPISISVSRVLAHTALTPNQFTLLTGLLGIATGVLLAQGGYWGFALGAGMFHLTSILDGVDGELARLKFKSSDFGQWLDTLVDNSSYILALAGFLIGLFRDGVSGFEKIAGILTLSLTALALGSMYLYLKRFKKGGSLLNIEYGFQKGETVFDKFMLVMAAFGRRDLFALIFFGLGLFGILQFALVYICVLTTALFAFSILAHVQASRK